MVMYKSNYQYINGLCQHMNSPAITETELVHKINLYAGFTGGYIL